MKDKVTIIVSPATGEYHGYGMWQVEIEGSYIEGKYVTKTDAVNAAHRLADESYPSKEVTLDVRDTKTVTLY